MRIVIDCRCVFEGCGGIGRYARSLVEALLAVNDYDEFVLLRSDQRAGEAIANGRNVTERRVDAGMLDWDFDQLQLPEILKKLQAELYHNPTFCVPVIRTCRQVATVHDVVFRDRPDLVPGGLREYLDRASGAAAVCADRLITVSEYSKGRLCERYGVAPDRVDVTLEAASAQFVPRYGGAMEQQLRARHGIEGPFVLYVGALEPKKNLDRLLEAFGRVKRKKGVSHSLVLTGGTGAMGYDAREAAEAFGVGDHTIITGYLPESELPYAYNAADLFIYPSLYEGFGLPVLEAMSCGTPVIASETTSLPEVVGDAGILVDPTDTGRIAEAIEGVLNNPQKRSRLSARSRKRAAQFSWQATALQTLETYRLAVG